MLPKYLGSAQVFIASSSRIFSKIFLKLLIIEDIFRFVLSCFTLLNIGMKIDCLLFANFGTDYIL